MHGIVSFSVPSITNTNIVQLNATQTLTNKTLTSPVIKISGDNTITLPSTAGTLALTTDIPTNNNQLTNDSGYITATSTNTLFNKNLTDGTNTFPIAGIDASGTLGCIRVGSDLKINASGILDINATPGQAIASQALVVDGSRNIRDINNLTISGNLTVAGTTTQIDSTTVTVKDGMFKYASDNSGNDTDFGWYGQYGGIGGAPTFSGMFRDAHSGKFHLFKDTTDEPGVSVNMDYSDYAIKATLVCSIEGDLSGNAATATVLETARTIGGVSFDGSSSIDLPGVNIIGNQNTTGSAAKLTTPCTIGNVSFDGSSSIDLPGVNATGNQDTTGSAATLTTARTIGGVSFDGSSSIDLPGVNIIGNQNTTGNAATADKITSITNTNIVQLNATQTLTNKNLTDSTNTFPIAGIDANGTLGCIRVGTGLSMSEDVAGLLSVTGGDNCTFTTNSGSMRTKCIAGNNVIAWDAPGYDSFENGLIQIGNSSTHTDAQGPYLSPSISSIISDQNRWAMAMVAGTNDVNSNPDFLFQIKQNNNEDYGIQTGSGFEWRRNAAKLMQLTRDGKLCINDINSTGTIKVSGAPAIGDTSGGFTETLWLENRGLYLYQSPWDTYGQSGPGRASWYVTPGWKSFRLEFHVTNTDGNEIFMSYIKGDGVYTKEFSFTGQHKSKSLNDTIYNKIDDYVGLICYTTGEYATYDFDNEICNTDSSGITINDAMPVIDLTTTKKDKRVYGVISNREDSERTMSYGRFVSYLPSANDVNRVIVNSIGEGAIWVVNTNGNFENGDYIQSSDVAGYGERQDDDVLHNYTVAKITCDCDFDITSTKYKSRIINGNVACFVGCVYFAG